MTATGASRTGASRARAALAALAALVWTAVVVLGAASALVLGGSSAQAAPPRDDSATPTTTTTSASPAATACDVTASASASATDSASATPTSASPSPTATDTASPTSTAPPDPNNPTAVSFAAATGFTPVVTEIMADGYVAVHNTGLLTVTLAIPDLPDYTETVAAGAVGTDVQIPAGRHVITGTTGLGTAQGCLVALAASPSPSAGGGGGVPGASPTPGAGSGAGNGTGGGGTGGGGGGTTGSRGGGGGSGGGGGNFYNVAPGVRQSVPDPLVAASDLPQLPGEEGLPTVLPSMRTGLAGIGQEPDGAARYGLPLALAAVTLGGVGAALVRVLLAYAPRP